MLKVGLTGNIGSGKSLVSGIFQVIGVPVYHADQESKRFLFDETVKKTILNTFGSTVFNNAGEIDRKALGSIVFSHAEALSKLNQILHPLVKEHFREWILSQPERPYIIHEAAIIFESGFRQEYDKIVYVSCPRELAIERVIRRDGSSGSDILKRMQFQWEDEQKTGLSDFIIMNDGKKLLIPQVLDIHNKLQVSE